MRWRRDSRVTVMTSVPQQGAAWDRAYELEPLPPLPERRLDLRFGDALGADSQAPHRRLLSSRCAGTRIARWRASDAGRASEVAIVIGIWDTAAHFWCAAARRAGLPYYLFAYGVELLIPLYGRLPAGGATTSSRRPA